MTRRVRGRPAARPPGEESTRAGAGAPLGGPARYPSWSKAHRVPRRLRAWISSRGLHAHELHLLLSAAGLDFRHHPDPGGIVLVGESGLDAGVLLGLDHVVERAEGDRDVVVQA